MSRPLHAVFQQALTAAHLKKRAEMGDLAAAYQAYDTLLDLWSHGKADAATSRDYFDAGLSGRSATGEAVYHDLLNYSLFKTKTLLPQLETYAHGQYLETETFARPRRLNRHHEDRPLSAFNKLTLHRVRRLYELHLKHSQSPHSAEMLQEIQKKLAF